MFAFKNTVQISLVIPSVEWVNFSFQRIFRVDISSEYVGLFSDEVLFGSLPSKSVESQKKDLFLLFGTLLVQQQQSYDEDM